MYDDTALRRLLIELAASHPEHAAVIRAFTPLALARGKLLDAYALSRKTKPLDGFPMFRFEELPVCSENPEPLRRLCSKPLPRASPARGNRWRRCAMRSSPEASAACVRPASR